MAPAEATAPPTPRIVRRIASCRSAWRVSSLAEAGGDEEDVVRAGAEEHDGHDARGLPGDGQVELLGDRCADRAGDLED